MTLNQLKYVVSVARERHFGRAAEACHISQPTLSVAVKKLEGELGVKLFERRQGKIGVTAVGEEVIAQAQRVIEESEAIPEIVLQGKDPLAAPLRLGAIFTIGPYLFPHIIQELADRAPRMPLIVEENYTHVLAERLKMGELDIIIVSLPFDEPGILTIPLYEEPFVALLPSGHPLTQKKTLEIADIGKENVLMLGAGHCFRDQVMEICPECLNVSQGEKAGIRHSLEGGSLETIRYMVASGVGVTILPCMAAGADRFSERLVTIKRFANAHPHRQVALAWRKSYPRPQVIDVLRSAIRAYPSSSISLLN